MGNRRGKKVLIVDDEPNILVVLEFLIRKEGYEVHKAPGGAEALSIAAEIRPDIVVLDVMMPGLDGFEVARRIRHSKSLRDTAIIFLTAKGTQQDRFEGYDAGGEVYLTKPFDNDELINTINEVAEFG